MASSTSAIFPVPDVSDVTGWLKWAGFRFDPFGPLDAAADPHLSEYLVRHHIFARVWGDEISWVFAPAGGGKTALRISVMHACWVGLETNRPFPIPYVPPFLAWGHAHPSAEDHLEALARAGAVALFLTLAYRPHWFLRLDTFGRQRVAGILSGNLPGPLLVYLEQCHATGSPHALSAVLDPAFVLRNPPDPETTREWCEALEATCGEPFPSSPAERWAELQEVLRSLLAFPAVYILMDGLDGAPETIADPAAIARCLEPLLQWAEEWSEQRIFLKAFLPAEAQSLLEGRFPDGFVPARVSTIRWTPDLLAEVIRRRVYVATEGAFGSLDALASPALRDIETLLAKTVYPLPREMLVLSRRLIEERIRRGGEGLFTLEDLEAAIHYTRYAKRLPSSPSGSTSPPAATSAVPTATLPGAMPTCPRRSEERQWTEPSAPPGPTASGP